MDPTQRFSSRVDDYTSYRPSYPQEVLVTLRQECGLTPASSIADIGSGTGLLTALFLRNENDVFAVEPNPEMRLAGERLMGDYPGFHSIAARAEATTLPENSVDFIVAGQAFHWFDRQKARREFARILKAGGWVALIWNMRQSQASPVMQAYEDLIQRYATDYPQVHHRRVGEKGLADFYPGRGYLVKTFHHRQELDLAGLKGRLMSSSYAPQAGHPNYTPMMNELVDVFRQHAVEDRVSFEYATQMYYGQW